MDTASVLSATAATVAALLAGANLVVSGRRETRRWWREVLIEVFAGFLDSSYQTEAACREFSRVDRDHLEYEAARDRYHEQIQDAHSAQLRYLTRLRLLSSPDAVRAARALHEAGHDLEGAAFADAVKFDPLEVSRAREAHATATNELLTAARRMIVVRGPTGHVDVAG